MDQVTGCASLQPFLEVPRLHRVRDTGALYLVETECAQHLERRRIVDLIGHGTDLVRPRHPEDGRRDALDPGVSVEFGHQGRIELDRIEGDAADLTER